MGQRLAISAFWTVFAVNLAASLVARSPTLLGESLHSLADALVVTFTAYSLKLLHGREGFTYGLHRAEVLSSVLNVLTVVVGAIAGAGFAVVYLVNGVKDDPLVLLAVSLVSFAVVTAVVLRSEEEERSSGIWLHALQDSLSFVVGAVAGAVILVTGISEVDAVSAFLVLALMILTSLGTLRESFDVLMERSPVDVKGVEKEVENAFGHVEDLHVWSICRHNRVATAHVRVSPNATVGELEEKRRELEKVLREKYGINHLTIQYEAEGCQKEEE